MPRFLFRLPKSSENQNRPRGRGLKLMLAVLVASVGENGSHNVKDQ
jgi:hypothetical protein